MTCWLDTVNGGRRTFAFLAIVSDDPRDLVDRIVERFGVEAAHGGRFAEGFDRTDAMATAMLSEAMADTLALATECPTSPLAAGLDMLVEQRFAS